MNLRILLLVALYLFLIVCAFLAFPAMASQGCFFFPSSKQIIVYIFLGFLLAYVGKLVSLMCKDDAESREKELNFYMILNILFAFCIFTANEVLISVAIMAALIFFLSKSRIRNKKANYSIVIVLVLGLLLFSNTNYFKETILGIESVVTQCTKYTHEFKTK